MKLFQHCFGAITKGKIDYEMEIRIIENFCASSEHRVTVYFYLDDENKKGNNFPFCFQTTP